MNLFDVNSKREVLVLKDVEGRQAHLLAPEDGQTMRNIGLVVIGLLMIVVGLVVVASLVGQVSSS